MKKIVQEVEGEGLVKLLGERVTLFCANYIYTGKLEGVNESCVNGLDQIPSNNSLTTEAVIELAV